MTRNRGPCLFYFIFFGLPALLVMLGLALRRLLPDLLHVTQTDSYLLCLAGLALLLVLSRLLGWGGRKAQEPYFNDEPIKGFDELCQRYLDEPLARYGFVKRPGLADDRDVRPYVRKQVYVKRLPGGGQRWVRIVANTHHHDAPNYLDAVLGDGEVRQPLSADEVTILSELAGKTRPVPASGPVGVSLHGYGIPSMAEMPLVFEVLAQDLFEYGRKFLESE